MKYKKINNLKFPLFIGLTIMVISFFVYAILKDVESLPEKEVPIVKETVLIPIISKVSLRDSIVSFGMKFLGTPYIKGGVSINGFDCSGFVYFVFRHFKIQVPRSSALYKNFGTEISIDSVKMGDILVFLSPTGKWLGHVGIVSNPKGKESDFIHASSGVEMKVIISSLKSVGYHRRLVKAVNVL
jgi:hypothetical protein